MFMDVPGWWYARKVDMIVCMMPRLGSPAAALESVRLIAFGLSPDSYWPMVSRSVSHDSGAPVSFKRLS